MSVKKFYNLAKNRFFPINRSITGNGIRKTLHLIKKQFPELKIIKIPSKTKVFDWVVPSEWNVTDAYVFYKNNKKIIDFKNNNLHLVGYSNKVNLKISKQESSIICIHCQIFPIQKQMLFHIMKKWGFYYHTKQKLFLIKNINQMINLKY